MSTNYRHLERADRVQIPLLLARGTRQNKIAQLIGFSAASVSREIAGTRARFTQGSYFASRAQRLHDLNRKSAGAQRRKLGPAFDSPLARTVIADLRKGWSPVQVRGRIRENNLYRLAPEPTLSHEALYAARYAQPRGQLRSELVKPLRKSRSGRLPRSRGSEMSLHKDLARRRHIDLFFCDPCSAAQRATNENANGLVREYLPKGMDLSKVIAQKLRIIADKLNNRHREILGFRTPNEVVASILRDHAASVAPPG